MAVQGAMTVREWQRAEADRINRLREHNKYKYYDVLRFRRHESHKFCFAMRPRRNLMRARIANGKQTGMIDPRCYLEPEDWPVELRILDEQFRAGHPPTRARNPDYTTPGRARTH